MANRISRRQEREKAVAKKRAKGKLRKSHEFGKQWPMDGDQMRTKFITGENP